MNYTVLFERKNCMIDLRKFTHGESIFCSCEELKQDNTIDREAFSTTTTVTCDCGTLVIVRTKNVNPETESDPT